MSGLFLSAFITLFVVIDPSGCAPIYAGLTKGATLAQSRAIAVRAPLIATSEIEDVSVFPMAMPMLAGPGGEVHGFATANLVVIAAW